MKDGDPIDFGEFISPEPTPEEIEAMKEFHSEMTEKQPTDHVHVVRNLDTGSESVTLKDADGTVKSVAGTFSGKLRYGAS